MKKKVLIIGSPLTSSASQYLKQFGDVEIVDINDLDEKLKENLITFEAPSIPKPPEMVLTSYSPIPLSKKNRKQNNRKKKKRR